MMVPNGKSQTIEPGMIVIFVGVSLGAHRIVAGRNRVEEALRISERALQIAKDQTEALNQQLERRVQERTAELRESTERLRAQSTSASRWKKNCCACANWSRWACWRVASRTTSTTS